MWSRVTLCMGITVFVLGFRPSFAFSSVATGFYDNSKGSPVVQLIDQTQSTLDMEIYEMDDPQVIAALRGALARGVIVHVVKEPKPVGAACKVFDGAQAWSNSKPAGASKSGSESCADQQKLVDDVNSAGGKYVPFAKPGLCGGNGTKNCLEHGKIVVSDSKLALITSGNFNTTNLCDRAYSPTVCNRDYSYVSDDAATVGTLQNVVEADILGQPYDVSSVLIQGAEAKLTVGPNSLDPMVSFLRSAKTQILIENQYLKDPTINQALTDAAKAGIQVEVIVSSACSFGRPRPSEVSRLTSIFDSFDQAGIATKMFNKKILVDGVHGYLHAKAIVVDGQRAWMGSVNGSTQATTLNREFGVFFDDPAQVQKLSSVMSADFSNPNEESWQDSLQCAENH